MTIISSTGRTIFSQYDVVATPAYVYTSAAGVAAGDGWFLAKSDNNSVVVELATLTAGIFYYRIEGRADTYTRPFNIYNNTKTTADTIGEVITLGESVKEVRVGVRVDDSAASPNYLYVGLIQSGSR